MDFSASLIVELTLAGLLAATLYVCVRLERRLRTLRKDQDSLSGTVRALNSGIATAQASLAGLRAAANDTDETLGKSVTAARALADELALLTAAGERIAARIETARQTGAAGGRKPLSPEALRAVR